jgi:simple sugar transport system substrate-binding protein
MSQASFRSILSGLAVVIGLALTPSLATAEGIKIAVVTHGQSADSYWGVVKKGVDDAAKLMGVDVSYQAPPTTDMVAMCA